MKPQVFAPLMWNLVKFRVIPNGLVLPWPPGRMCSHSSIAFSTLYQQSLQESVLQQSSSSAWAVQCSQIAGASLGRGSKSWKGKKKGDKPTSAPGPVSVRSEQLLPWVCTGTGELLLLVFKWAPAFVKICLYMLQFALVIAQRPCAQTGGQRCPQ